MDNPRHIKRATRIMFDHPSVFLPGGFDSLSEEGKEVEMSKSYPYATLLWQFCVLLCRQLFEGEHILRPEDAQLLGLVDEVAGGATIQSQREFAKTQKNSDNPDE